jgi:hypothetical protein
LVSETLDNLDAEYQLGISAGSLLWIDTQGHEGHVLEGAKHLIDCGRIKFVVAEFWPYGLERANGKEKFFDFLRRCSAIYDLRQANWQNSEPLTEDQAMQKYDALLVEGVNHTDLLCIV